MKKAKTAVVKVMDSEEARTIAAWAMGHHLGAREAAATSVLRAVACGVQLCKGKILLGHGDFGKWFHKYIGTAITERTAQRYMALIDGLRISSGKSDTVSQIPEFLSVFDVSPDKLTIKYAKSILPRVGKLIEGNTVTELYQEFGIIKPRKHCDDEYQARLKRAEDAAKDPRDRKEVQLLFAMDLFGDIETRLDQWASCVKEIEDSAHAAKALDRLVDTLEKLTGCTVTLGPKKRS